MLAWRANTVRKQGAYDDVPLSIQNGLLKLCLGLLHAQLAVTCILESSKPPWRWPRIGKRSKSQTKRLVSRQLVRDLQAFRGYANFVLVPAVASGIAGYPLKGIDSRISKAWRGDVTKDIRRQTSEPD